MATNFSPCKGSHVLNQFPSNVMFGMNGFHVSASGAIQGHHGPLVVLVRGLCFKPIPKYCNAWYEGLSCISQWSDTGPSWPSCFWW